MKYVLWAAIGLSALAFAAAGVAKLMGVPMVHASFANMGLPSWFGYFIGICELAGAIGLLIRRLSGLAAADWPSSWSARSTTTWSTTSRRSFRLSCCWS